MFAVPCEKEIAQCAQPVPRQLRVKAWAPPIIVIGIGSECAHLPAGGGGAGFGLGTFAQQKKRDAAFFCQEGQSSAGNQIERAGAAGNLQHHCPHMRAGENVSGSGQRVVRMRGAQQKQVGGIAAQLQQTGG